MSKTRWMIVLLTLLFLDAGGQRPRPEIDQRAPARLETAVFAMG